jgi:ATP-dependent Lon protease
MTSNDYHMITRSNGKKENTTNSNLTNNCLNNNSEKNKDDVDDSKKRKQVNRNNSIKKIKISSDDDDKMEEYLLLMILLKKLSGKYSDELIEAYNIDDKTSINDSDIGGNINDNIVETSDIESSDDDYDGENIIDNNELLLIKEKELLEKFGNTSNIPFKETILNSRLNDQTKVNILNQINYCNTLDETASEYQKMNLWLKSLEKIPFTNTIQLPISYKSPKPLIVDFLGDLQTNLNECIYGQHGAKESILQIITQIITNPSSKGSIIALKGPPGVGKTSLIKNGLSKSLNIPFSFISLAGISDASYFDGFSYTYEGSKYGKIAEILMQTNCMNPIIFMDELDKISATDRGDEINNLLIHLTDFTQNDHFEDKYFTGIPIDLSKAIFIFSLNDENLINPILKDRLNVVNLEKFNINDKINIAHKYLIPELIDNIGIKEQITFSNNNIEFIIKNYASNEDGVRDLKRCLETVLRKINLFKYSKKIDLSYHIKNIKFPLELKNEYIEELLKERKKSEKMSNLMMYI